MATELGPNLEPGREAVERLMDDMCRITRETDQGQVVYDGSTHPDYADPFGSGGARCMVSEEPNTRSALGNEDDEYRYPYRAGIPVSVTEVDEGDVLEVLSARRDQALVGTRWIVRGVRRGTFAVSRRFKLERDVPARRYE